MRVARLLAPAAALLLALPAASVPVQLTLATGQNEGGFRFSFLHEATRSCTTVATVDQGTVEFCMNGQPVSISGTLTADLTAGVLSDILGTLAIQGGGTIDVTGGTIDFTATAADEFGQNHIETSSHGTFWFLDRTWMGPANGFDGTTLRLWGNNWNSGNPGDPGSFDRFGIDLGALVVPEPGTLALLGLGLAGLSLGGRRGPRPPCTGAQPDNASTASRSPRTPARIASSPRAA